MLPTLREFIEDKGNLKTYYQYNETWYRVDLEIVLKYAGDIADEMLDYNGPVFFSPETKKVVFGGIENSMVSPRPYSHTTIRKMIEKKEPYHRELLYFYLTSEEKEDVELAKSFDFSNFEVQGKKINNLKELIDILYDEVEIKEPEGILEIILSKESRFLEENIFRDEMKEIAIDDYCQEVGNNFDIESNYKDKMCIQSILSQLEDMETSEETEVWIKRGKQIIELFELKPYVSYREYQKIKDELERIKSPNF